MAIFSYSFCMALLHSFWQSALLMLLYLLAEKFFLQKNSPLVKRNFLFTILLSQLLLFTLSFSLFYNGYSLFTGEERIGRTITGFFRSETLQSATPWIFLFYSLMVCYKLGKSVYAWFGFKQKYRLGLLKPDVELKVFTELKAYQFGITRKVKLWFSNSIHTPVTFGFFKPVILIPVALVNNINTRQAETLIIHELTHIRTNDYLLNWFLLFSETIFFFNPFVLAFCNKIRMEREKSCDMGVMAFEYSPVLYAETLLQAERMKQMVPGFQLAAVNRKKQLLDRIRFFSGTVNYNQPLRFNIFVPAIGLILLMFFSTAVLYRSADPGFSSLQESAGLPGLPFSSIEFPSASFVNSSLPQKNDLYAQVKEMKKQVPSPEKKLKELKPLISNIEKGSEAAIINLFDVMPVSVSENDAAKQIIVQEESSGSDKSASIKTYSLRFENGQWILEPVWNITATEISEDSVIKKMDSSKGRLRRIIPPQQ